MHAAPADLRDVNPASGRVQIVGADTTHKWKTLSHMKRYCCWMLYVSLGVVMLGFDWSCYPQLLAIPTFAQKYGHWDATQKLYIISSGRQAAWNGSSSAAQVIGGFVSGFVMDKIGRRWWLFFLSSLGMLSIGVVYASPNWKVLCAGRLIQGFSIGGLTTFSPVYIGENSVPELRGFFLVSFNTFIVVGQFLITLVNRGTNTISNEWAWRIPILTMFIYPGIVLLGFYWFPESPYYLICKKKDDEAAKKALYQLYGSHKHDVVETQLHRIKASIKSGEQLMHVHREGSFLDVFRGKNLKRTITAVFASGAQQIIGVVFVVGYVPYFLTLSGIPWAFNWTMYLFTVNLIGNILSFWTVENFGRRNMVVYGLGILAVLELIIGGLNVHVSHTKLYATIAVTYMWAFVYQTTIGALGFTLASEVATISLRSETQSLVTVANAGLGWVFSFSIPYMINPDAANLGGKIGFIFGPFAAVCFVIGWFLFPETKGLTFAELDYLYANNTPAWRFKSTVRARRADGTFDRNENDVDSTDKAVEVHIEQADAKV